MSALERAVSNWTSLLVDDSTFYYLTAQTALKKISTCTVKLVTHGFHILRGEISHSWFNFDIGTSHI